MPSDEQSHRRRRFATEIVFRRSPRAFLIPDPYRPGNLLRSKQLDWAESGLGCRKLRGGMRPFEWGDEGRRVVGG